MINGEAVRFSLTDKRRPAMVAIIPENRPISIL
jgi:hypothetical protein